MIRSLADLADEDERGSAIGIIFELSRMGGGVQVNHFVSKFEYSASRVIPAAAARTPKNQRKEGGKFPAQFATVSNNEPSS